MKLSPQTIDALAEVISGGSQNDPTPSIGIYRSGPKIERFMLACGETMSVGNGSRVPALVHALLDVNRREDETVLTTIVERAADPRDFVHDEERFTAVLAHLNSYLRLDGYELQRQGARCRLLKAGTSSPVVGSLTAAAEVLDFDTVSRDLKRALDNAEEDPEDAVTAACAVVESVCRSILVELSLPLPAKRDVQGLYRAVREPLGLAPEKVVVADEVADDVRSILGSLAGAVGGIGSLRTHGGDAHGRERGAPRRVDARIARLAIHSAGAMALFLIETWQAKHPRRHLHPIEDI